MKVKFITLLLALCAVWSLQSCDNDDDDSISVPTELKNVFSSKYPNAVNVKWENKAGYYVADFYDGYEASAWYSSDYKWHMTETDIPYAALPDKVKSAFEESEYASWRKDDVDKLEREGLETVYIIEVENANQEVDLYYSADGVFIKSIVDVDDDGDQHFPGTKLTAEMEAFINEKYAGARIMEVDVEDDRNDWDFGYTEVDIIHDGQAKEVKFDKAGAWYSTSWDVHILPIVVGNTIETQFPGYRVDDSDYYEMPDGTTYYLVELERNNAQDIYVKIDPDGTVIE